MAALAAQTIPSPVREVTISSTADPRVPRALKHRSQHSISPKSSGLSAGSRSMRTSAERRMASNSRASVAEVAGENRPVASSSAAAASRAGLSSTDSSRR